MKKVKFEIDYKDLELQLKDEIQESITNIDPGFFFWIPKIYLEVSNKKILLDTRFFQDIQNFINLNLDEGCLFGLSAGGELINFKILEKEMILIFTEYIIQKNDLIFSKIKINKKEFFFELFKFSKEVLNYISFSQQIVNFSKKEIDIFNSFLDNLQLKLENEN